MAATLSSAFRFLLLLPLILGITHAATFEIVNRCSDTVWPAAAPGGGTQLNPGQSWTITVNPGTAGGRIWARTSCSFDGSGRGSCQTGDCGGLLQCQGTGRPPATLAEFSLNQFNNLDFFDISNIEGFNVPLDFRPTTGGCNGVSCTADIVGQCPAELRAPGGCNNPCTVSGNCEPSEGSMFFKRLCPEAYSYPNDSGTVSCPGGTNYRITFCP